MKFFSKEARISLNSDIIIYMTIQILCLYDFTCLNVHMKCYWKFFKIRQWTYQFWSSDCIVIETL